MFQWAAAAWALGSVMSHGSKNASSQFSLGQGKSISATALML